MRRYYRRVSLTSGLLLSGLSVLPGRRRAGVGVVIALALVVLYRRASRGSARELAALRWAVAAVLTGVAVAAVLAGPARADTGPWTSPLAGALEVGRGFEPPEVRYAAGHRGVDLMAEPGAPVLAAGDGTVSYAGLLAGRGVVVVVHGALRTTYEPVSALVSVGDVVIGGDPLGSLEPGHLGCPAAACLHWGLRRGQDYLDPLALVLRRPPRLLPLADGALARTATADRSLAGTDPIAPGAGAAPSGRDVGSGRPGDTPLPYGRVSAAAPLLPPQEPAPAGGSGLAPALAVSLAVGAAAGSAALLRRSGHLGRGA